ncbi:hypothetical protein [Streptomyces bikiniensis]|uniref:hypothetical protein n=1 Tax=Streptomyces bikiniensis TaxID=1896 RepID=UPI00068FC33D|nr:hypothetical protein [Streptomyces bikiniensis]
MELEERFTELERRIAALEGFKTELSEAGPRGADGGVLFTGTTGQIYHHLRQLTGAGRLHTSGRGRYEVPAARVVPLLMALTAARP